MTSVLFFFKTEWRKTVFKISLLVFVSDNRSVEWLAALCYCAFFFTAFLIIANKSKEKKKTTVPFGT